MGCDVHMWAEIKVPDSNGVPAWQIVREVACSRCVDDEIHLVKVDPACFRCNGSGVSKLHWEQNDSNEPLEVGNRRTGYWYGANIYSDRNYRLFAALANVRNYGDEIDTPIPQRGIPEDASPEYAQEAADVDGHSHSWMTVGELAAVFLSAYDQTYLGSFVKVYHRTLRPLADEHGDDNVRIVFYFNN